MNNTVNRGKQASVDGFAHEHIAVGLLMKRYQNVSLVDLPLSPYDIIIVLRKLYGEENIIKCQVKTATRTVNFTGGTRGGIDRLYISGVKEYIQSTKTSDVVIGVTPVAEHKFDLYFVPTVLIEYLDQKSISINRIKLLKNNYDILERCKDREYVIEKCKEYKII